MTERKTHEEDTLLKTRMNRRRALSTGAKVGVAAGVAAVAFGAGGYLAGTMMAPEKIVERTATTTVTQAAQTITSTVTAAGVTGPRYKFTFVGHWTGDDPFHAPLKKGFEDCCNLYGIDHAWTMSSDMPTQLAMLETAIAGKPDGIVSTFMDPRTMNPAVKKAIGMGIPVIGSNVDAPESGRLAYVGQDLYAGGYVLGKYVAPMLPKGAHVLIPAELPGLTYAIERSRGIVDGIKLTDPTMTYEILDHTMERAKGEARIVGYLEGHPETKAVLGVGGITTGVTSTVLRAKDLKGKVVGGGFDLTPDTNAGIKDGFMAASIDQQPYLQGYLPALMIWFYLQYKLDPWSVETLVGVVDKNNVDAVLELAKQGYR